MILRTLQVLVFVKLPVFSPFRSVEISVLVEAALRH